MLIIPAIDLQSGKCVRLSQGRKGTATIYNGDPVKVAQEFELAGARMLHIVDLNAAFSDRLSSHRVLLREIIRAIKIPVQFGGGLRNSDDIEQVIELGVRRVIIGTLAVESPNSLEAIVQKLGGDRVAVAIDAKNGEVMARGWEHKGKTMAVELAQLVAKAGVSRIIYTDVSRDGMLTGINVEQTVLVARESGVKVTAAGGISSLGDIRELVELNNPNIDSVIVGRALYQGRFTLQEALEV